MKPPNLENPGHAFEALYRANADPWNFVGSEYERGRYAATLAALSRKSYGRAFEPGCSIGELTVCLAARCNDVIAVDISPSAVARARRRCDNMLNVHIECADLKEAIPPGPFDLVVLSEIGYYFSKNELREITTALSVQLQWGGEFVAVHWLGHSTDHILHGDTVHEVLRECLPLQWQTGERHQGFRIDRWANS